MKKKKKKERKKTGRETLTEEEFCGDSYAFVSHQRRDRDEGVKGMPPIAGWCPAVWVWQLRVYGSIVGAACLLA